MADKKMNDFATASDGAYIYAESASGEQIKISKADLASVVAGLMKINIIRFTLGVGESKTITTPFACEIFVTENAGAVISGVINKRMNSLTLIAGPYIGTSSSGSEALVIYAVSSTAVTVTNNQPDSMFVTLHIFG